jgi:hypothetical protein
MGTEVAYAFLSFTRTDRSRAQHDTAIRLLGPRLPQPDHTPDYLPLELAELPKITKPRVEPKKLSTGQMALEIARVGTAWRISCTGCGEASPVVQFRWQVLDQTVACRCE